MVETASSEGQQLTLAGLPVPRAERRARRPAGAPAASRPVASVVVDRPQPHLDRPFEYAVPQSLDEAAQPGVRVKVRFGGQDVDGFVVERLDEAEHTGTLTPLRRVVSAEPVLGPEVL
ncbi:MAG TPA: primosomal protein N', partial [Actinotalea sp.]